MTSSLSSGMRGEGSAEGGGKEEKRVVKNVVVLIESILSMFIAVVSAGGSAKDKRELVELHG